MTVDLYNTTDDPRKIGKTLTTIATGITCKPSQPFSILTPRIILNNTAGYTACNYVYIPDFSRYYFAEINMLTGVEIEIVCSVDVLNSYDLSNVPILATRSESAGVNFFPDRQLPVDPSRCFIEGILFPDQPLTESAIPSGEVWENNNYLIVVNGN